jgi:hypothetical protein
MMMMIVSMGWDYISELPPAGLLFHPLGDVSVENHGGMTLAGENIWIVHQSSLKILPTVIL